MLYGATVRFYNTLMVYNELDEMKEDLIERVTTMLFHNPNLTNLVMKFCKIATQKEQKIFERRLLESQELNIKPTDLSVSKFFTLDNKSNILDYYRK